MKRLSALCLVVSILAPTLRAGPAEQAIVAAMRLSEQPNYSWVATVSDDARTYDIDGKTDRRGFSFVKMPVINSVRRRLGRSVTDTSVEVIFQGNVACVIQTVNGWMRPEELPPADDLEAESILSPASGHAPLGRGTSPGSMVRGSVMRSGRGPQSRKNDERHYSNLQLAVSLPHEELAVIVGSHQSFEIEGDLVTGALTDLGAQLLLVRDGQKDISPLRAAGTFKLWLRDGIVAKYQVRLQGVLSVETPRAGRRDIEVQQTTNTIVKEIGTTKFDVPTEAQAKLALAR